MIIIQATSNAFHYDYINDIMGYYDNYLETPEDVYCLYKDQEYVFTDGSVLTEVLMIGLSQEDCKS